jgi:A/G-specific adenine glycosylase
MTLAGEGKPRKRKANGSAPSAPAAELLAWYDRHRRVLPWRAPRGHTPDPYRVWLSEIMLQQTSVKTVAPYYARFLARWPDIESLAAAPLDEVLKSWAGLGYYARARNLDACAKAVVRDHHGYLPDSEEVLRKLPGIGGYTAAAIAAIAFDRHATPIDGNIERVIARLFAVRDVLPKAKPIIRGLAQQLTPLRRAGDFAQAMMDLGATICTPKKPACVLCPWLDACAARRRGDPEKFPLKTAKREGKLRGGAVFVLIRADGAVLVRRRAEKGLLGGMIEVPSTDWTHGFDERRALERVPVGTSAKWRRIPGSVTHTFTHFPLELAVFTAKASAKTKAPAGMRWLARADLAGEAFPNLMRKVLAHALGPHAFAVPAKEWAAQEEIGLSVRRRASRRG